MDEREKRYHAHKAFDGSGRLEVKCRKCGCTSYVAKPKSLVTRLRMVADGDAGPCPICGAERKR